MSAIRGVWKNPTKARCDVKATYSSMAIAEAKANRASRRAGHLIIAYKCFDCCEEMESWFGSLPMIP